MYRLIEYSDNYSKTSRILWQYCKDEPALADYGTIVDFTSDNADTDLFKIRQKKPRSNRKQRIEKCSNNGSFKISK